jgi:hypothetical protein
MALTASSGLTEAQSDLIAALDDVSEHVAWEFDPDEYRGVSTCGFAHVANVSGNGSFVRRVKSLAASDDGRFEERRSGGYEITLSGLELTVIESHRGGYRVSVSNVREFRSGPEYQRLDVRKELNRLLKERLQYNGYVEDAFVRSRMD